MVSRKFYFFAGLLLVLALAVWGCPKKSEVASAPETPAAEAQKGAAETPKAAENSQAPEQAAQSSEAKEAAGTAAEGLKPIYFDFDKAVVTADASAVLKEDAAWLKAHPAVKIRIEGNCDERGTKEYNQALGQRRATSAKKYLTDLGISARRIALISYGKEKPVCTENSENCWQKDRRDDFVSRE